MVLYVLAIAHTGDVVAADAVYVYMRIIMRVHGFGIHKHGHPHTMNAWHRVLQCVCWRSCAGGDKFPCVRDFCLLAKCFLFLILDVRSPPGWISCMCCPMRADSGEKGLDEVEIAGIATYNLYRFTIYNII